VNPPNAKSAMDADQGVLTLSVYRIWQETSTRLGCYERRVSEGVDLMPALDFARFVFWSGIPDLCEQCHAVTGALKTDGSALRKRAKALQSLCEEMMTGEAAPRIHETQMEAINRKLDLIAGHVGRWKG